MSAAIAVIPPPFSQLVIPPAPATITVPRWRSRLAHAQVDRRRWALIEPLVFDSAAANRRLVAPVDFIYDGASVPRVPIAYWWTGGRGWAPAALHDYLYQHPEWDGDRALADAIFAEALATAAPELGHDAEPAWARGLMWTGVRAGGWWAWSRYEKRGRAMNPEWTATAWPDPSAAPEAP